MISKIQSNHRKKPAYIYIRQSTMGQVRHHHESTERQYALKDKAIQLGWAPSAIRVLDQDLGKSGTQMTSRKDFKTLVTDVSMGQVGALFALEASRLARSCLDWQRLLEICSITETIVIDEDGCYDPSDFNDGLLLGLKGTIAQAELHFIRARLQGGKLNKAKKGELRFPLPVGFCYDDQNRIVIDPDKEVQGAVRTVFAAFRKTGSAYKVMREFTHQGLLFPKRSYGGIWDGKLIWGKLTHSRVLGVLKNPSYTGTYVYGRYRSTKQISSEGEVRTQLCAVPMDDWLVMIKDHHDSYISWEEYEKNQHILKQNRTNGEETLLSGPAREGLALLQGLLICSGCGRRLTVRYKGNGGIYPSYQCNWRKREGLSTADCITIRGDLLDTAVCQRVLEVIKPAQIEMAIKAVQELQNRENGVARQWEMRLERVEYEVQLAEKRYMEVDPSNRLVASTLEFRWNDDLVRFEKLKQQYNDFQKKELHVATSEQKKKIMELAKDFPRVWNASTTKAKDKKRMLRLLIKDITVERSMDRRQALLHIRWQGGALEDLPVNLPAPIADRLRYPDHIVATIRNLAKKLPDSQIASTLNQRGLLSAKKKSFTVSIIRWVRYKHKIPAFQPPKNGNLSVKQVAEKFDVSTHVVYYWIRCGRISGARLNQGSPYRLSIDSQKEQELIKLVQSSSKIHKSNQNKIVYKERSSSLNKEERGPT